MVGMIRLELTTTRPPDVYANQLRYIPIADAKVQKNPCAARIFVKIISAAKPQNALVMHSYLNSMTQRRTFGLLRNSAGAFL